MRYKRLLKEDPDVAHDVHWRDKDVIVFFVSDYFFAYSSYTISGLNYTPSHGDFFQYLRLVNRVAETIEKNSDRTPFDDINEFKLACHIANDEAKKNSISIFEIDIFNFKKFIDMHKHTQTGVSDYRSDKSVLQGRIWLNNKIISFWNNPVEIKQHFLNILDHNLKKIGIDLKELQFDNWTNDNLSDVSFVSYRNYFDIEQNNNTIDGDKYKSILKKLHTAPSEKKQELLKQLGVAPGSEKYNELAKKNGYNSIAQFKWKHTMYENTNNSDLCVIESVIDQAMVRFINIFIKHAKKRLNIINTYPVSIVGFNEIKTTTAYFNPNNQCIKVAAFGRALPDILRSIAHELVHAKQYELGVLNVDSGKTGHEHENQANIIAGILLREFSKRHPKIYTLQSNE